MDPDAALEEIRRLSKKINAGRVGWGDAEKLAQQIQALDEWLTSGGFPPKPWTWKVQ